MVSSKKPWMRVPLVGVAAGVLLGACGEGQTDGGARVGAGSPVAALAGNGRGGGDGGGGGGGGQSDAGASTETSLGNNLSNPVVFAEGLGLTGLPVTDSNGAVYVNTGLRPTSSETVPPVTSVPYFYPSDAPEYQTTVDGVVYYKQQTPNAWQPQWSGKTTGVAHTTVDWSDNLVRQTWTTNSVVRVEVVLDDLLDTAVVSPNLPTPENLQPMTGFNMRLLEGTGKTEMWGTDGTTAAFNATVFSVCPRLQISKCQGPYDTATGTCGGTWVMAVNLWTHDALAGERSSGLSAEVNVSGKLVYGYNWMLRSMPGSIDGVPIDKGGWWRISFTIDDGSSASADGGATVACNLALDNLYPTDLHAYYEADAAVAPAAAADGGEGETATDPVLYEPQLLGTSTWVDVLIATNRGGGRR